MNGQRHAMCSRLGAALLWASAAASGALAAPAAAPAPLQLAWLDAQGQWQAKALDAQGRPLATGAPAPDKPVPLGSLWKLVAWAQWVESATPERPLQCTGQSREEVYCCQPGESIGRATALVRSCSLYFSADRVPWGQPAGTALRALPAPLAQAVRQGTLGPDTRVPLQAWLQWLAAWPAALREQAGHDLLGYWLAGPGRSALPWVGGQLRVKTWTLEQADGTRRAGASGWNAQGLPLWFGGTGSSANLVPARATQVVAAVQDASPPPPAAPAPGGLACVRVRYFARYPLASVSAMDRSAAAQPGPLRGRYRLAFANGQQIEIRSQGEMRLAHEPDSGRPLLWAELPLEDYVARVIDREGAAQPAQAAWALAVAARSHVLAHGQARQGCLEVDDASHAQRVAPRPATAAAQQAAQATAGLVLAGGYAIAGQYHQHRAADGVMAWATARQQADQGARFTDILQAAYPRATLGSASAQGALACESLPLVQAWLDRQRTPWRRALQGEPGFADPASIQVCRQQHQRAHARTDTRRIDVHGYQTLEDRLAIAHEYLHLAFAGHPRGRDEPFIEARARQLLGVTP